MSSDLICGIFLPYRSARDENVTGSIWLNANESPYTFSPASVGVKLNRYPQKQPETLMERISETYQVPRSQILLSRGSDEGIDLLVRLCCSAGKDAIMVCTPTYGMYSVSARLQEATVLTVPLNKENDFQLDVENIQSHWQANVKLIFLCSPNNPTGNVLNKQAIFDLCRLYANQSLIVVDEAYIEFADQDSLTPHLQTYPNLVILRTSSKAYGMAAARFGLLFAHPDLIQWLLKIIAPYPLSSLVSELVFDSFSKDRLQQVKQQIETIKTERARLMNALRALPYVKKVWPSEANFLLMDLDHAEAIMQACAKQGVVLRSMFDKPGLEQCIRISVGLPDENTQLIQLLTSLR